METTKITVISCVKMREKDGKPIYAVGLSDGRGGESFAQEIPIGTDSSQLELTQSQWGLKVKMKGAGGFSGGGFKRSTYNEADKFPGFALAYSKDLVVAGKAELKDILTNANKFHKWLLSKHQATPAAPAAAAPAPAPSAPVPDFEPAPSSNGSDDLPF